MPDEVHAPSLATQVGAFYIMRDQDTLLRAHLQKNPFAKEVYDNILNYTPEQIDAFDNTDCRKWVKKLLKKQLVKVQKNIADRKLHVENCDEEWTGEGLSPEEIAAMMPTNDVDELFEVYRFRGSSSSYHTTAKSLIEITHGDYIMVTSGGIKVNQHFTLGKPDQYTVQLIQQCERIAQMKADEYSKLAGEWVLQKPHGCDSGASYEEALARVNQRISNSVRIG